MSNIIALVPTTNEIAEAGTCAVRRFLAREADALRTLLETVGEFDAANAILEIERLMDGSNSETRPVDDALKEIRMALAEIPFRDIENIARSRDGPRDLHAAVRWYGARITDLENGLTD